MELTAENVHTIILDCLYKPEEVPAEGIPDGAVIVSGIMQSFGFHPQRLESHREDVRSMLGQLNRMFFKDAKGGGSWSFLNLPMRADDTQWGEQMDAEALMALGMGLGMMRYLMPREMWAMLLGGMPYLEVDLDAGT